MAIIILILIYTHFIVLRVRAQCPSQCRCDSSTFLYEVVCPESPDFFPDLSVLTQQRKIIRLVIHLDPSKTLTKSDFPFNSTIVFLEIKSKSSPSLASEALIRLAHSLGYLSLQNAGISFKNKMTFLKGLTKLYKLVLSENRQTDGILHQDCFSDLNLTILTDIQLEDCNLTHIEGHPFYDLQSLLFINLQSNQIGRVSPAFDYTEGLRYMDLGNNSIKVIGNEAFRGVGKLRHLILNDNQHLTFESNCLSELRTVMEELVLRNCTLDDVPTCIRNFNKLKELDLADNPLTSFTRESLVGQMCLQELDVSGTKFPLSATIFSAQGNCLKTLSLNRRNLIVIPIQIFENLPNLRKISLKSNKIRTVPANAFKGFPITYLDLSENPLLTIDGNLFSKFGFNLYIGLKETALVDVEFVLHYERDKFRKIDLMGTNLVCSCSLYKIMLDLPNDVLYGHCMDGYRRVYLWTEQSKSYLQNKYNCDFTNIWSLWRRSDLAACDSNCIRTVRYERTCLKNKTCFGLQRGTRSMRCWESCYKVDGGWSGWFIKNSTDCSVTCGYGKREYETFRICTNPRPQNGGRNCVGQRTRHAIEPCIESVCPDDPGWASWIQASSSSCGVTCSVGVKSVTLIRNCQGTNGIHCDGPNVKTALIDCNTGVNCPGDLEPIIAKSVDGRWSPWVQFVDYDCSVTCGMGYRMNVRHRKCADPSPRYGGKLCQGSEKDVSTRECFPGLFCSNLTVAHTGSGKDKET